MQQNNQQKLCFDSILNILRQVSETQLVVCFVFVPFSVYALLLSPKIRAVQAKYKTAKRSISAIHIRRMLAILFLLYLVINFFLFDTLRSTYIQKHIIIEFSVCMTYCLKIHNLLARLFGVLVIHTYIFTCVEALHIDSEMLIFI